GAESDECLWARDSLTIRASATDAASGVAVLRMWVDGAIVGDPRNGVTFAAEGAHSIVAVAIDRAGNAADTLRTKGGIDRSKPGVEADLTSYSLWPPNGRKVTVHGNANVRDALSGATEVKWTVLDEYGEASGVYEGTDVD